MPAPLLDREEYVEQAKAAREEDKEFLSKLIERLEKLDTKADKAHTRVDKIETKISTAKYIAGIIAAIIAWLVGLIKD